MTHHLELLSQSNHRLFSVGHELLQVLIPQLLASTALPRALPASFCNGIAKENEGEKTDPLIREIDTCKARPDPRDESFSPEFAPSINFSDFRRQVVT